MILRLFRPYLHPAFCDLSKNQCDSARKPQLQCNNDKTHHVCWGAMYFQSMQNCPPFRCRLDAIENERHPNTRGAFCQFCSATWDCGHYRSDSAQDQKTPDVNRTLLHNFSNLYVLCSAFCIIHAMLNKNKWI